MGLRVFGIALAALVLLFARSAVADETGWLKAGAAPAIGRMTDGGFVVVHMTERGLVAQRFDAARKPREEAFPIEGGRGFADVVGTSDGGFAVAWVEYHSESRIRLNNYARLSPVGMFMRFYGPDAKPRGRVITLTTALESASVRLAALAGGRVAALWTSEEKPRGGIRDGEGLGVSAQVFDADGKTSGPIQVNTTLKGDQRAGRIAANKDGTGFVATWVSVKPGELDGLVMARTFDDRGRPQSAEIALDGKNLGDRLEPTTLSDGRYLIGWYRPCDCVLRTRILDGSGPVGEVKEVFTHTTFMGPFRLAELPGGRLLFVAINLDYKQDPDGLIMRRFEADGSPIGLQEDVSSGPGPENFDMVTRGDHIVLSYAMPVSGVLNAYWHALGPFNEPAKGRYAVLKGEARLAYARRCWAHAEWMIADSARSTGSVAGPSWFTRDFWQGELPEGETGPDKAEQAVRSMDAERTIADLKKLSAEGRQCYLDAEEAGAIP